MKTNQTVKELSEKEKIPLSEIETKLQLKMRLMPPTASKQSRKDEENNKKMLPACARCGDNHHGGCMKPAKPK